MLPVLITLWCIVAMPCKNEPVAFSVVNYFFIALIAVTEIYCIVMRFREVKENRWRDTDSVFPIFKTPAD